MHGCSKVWLPWDNQQVHEAYIKTAPSVRSTTLPTSWVIKVRDSKHRARHVNEEAAHAFCPAEGFSVPAVLRLGTYLHDKQPGPWSILANEKPHDPLVSSAPPQDPSPIPEGLRE